MFVITRKPVEEGTRVNDSDPNTSRVKSRWCLQGHLDPDLEQKAMDGVLQSPTLSQPSRVLLMPVLASFGWEMQLSDIKGAFMEAKEIGCKISSSFRLAPCRRDSSRTTRCRHRSGWKCLWAERRPSLLVSHFWRWGQSGQMDSLQVRSVFVHAEKPRWVFGRHHGRARWWCSFRRHGPHFTTIYWPSEVPISASKVETGNWRVLWSLLQARPTFKGDFNVTTAVCRNHETPSSRKGQVQTSLWSQHKLECCEASTAVQTGLPISLAQT